MAHRKAGGTIKIWDSKPKYLGTKLADGQKLKLEISSFAKEVQ